MPRNPVTASTDPSGSPSPTPGLSQAPAEELDEVLLELRPDFVQGASVPFADLSGNGG